MKKILIALVVFAASCMRPEEYTSKSLGVLQDARITGQSYRIEIKTDKMFLVLNSFDGAEPQLEFGKELRGYYVGDKLIFVEDIRGKQFRVE